MLSHNANKWVNIDECPPTYTIWKNSRKMVNGFPRESMYDQPKNQKVICLNLKHSF